MTLKNGSIGWTGHVAVAKARLAPPDEDHLDIQQLFAELSTDRGLSLRVGRQELMLSPLQRFVSFRDGTNVRQNFDGGRLAWTGGPLRVEAFLVRPVIIGQGAFDNARNRDQLFAGLYASRRIGGASLDAYWFRLDRDDLPQGRERRHSIGLRYAGARGRLDWDAEGVWQFGESAGRTIAAWAASADLGYTVGRAPLRPRVGLRFDAGSGDGDAGDDRTGGFYPLFPSGPYFNEANLTSWTNLIALRPSLRIQPAQRLTLTAAMQLRWRENPGDAVYVGPSAPVPGTLGNRARDVGQIYSFDIAFQVNRHLSVRGYYLHHRAGRAIGNAGGRGAAFAMTGATLRF